MFFRGVAIYNINLWKCKEGVRIFISKRDKIMTMKISKADGTERNIGMGLQYRKGRKISVHIRKKAGKK